ncbi:MAG: hypothetical protein ACXIU8_01645 [Alkalilacustris sp.]
MRIRVLSMVLAALVACVGSGSQAATVSGNPALDGWQFLGNSLDDGTYVRGTGGFDFAAFGTEFVLQSGPLLGTSPNWQIGDVILGFGGIMNTTVNATLRAVTKLGGADSGFTAAGPAGPGEGGTAAGGPGTVLVAYRFMRDDSATLRAPEMNGTLLRAETFVLVDRSGQSMSFGSDSDATDYARVMAVFEGSGTADDPHVVRSWQTYLNLSALTRDSRLGAVVPDPGAPSIVSFQQSHSNNFTDALVQLDAAGQPLAVIPLPATGWLLLGALGALAMAGRMRRRAA